MNEEATLSQAYSGALHDYLNGAGEPALHRAYEIGREAVRKGVGGLELSRIHQAVLLKTMSSVRSKEECKKIAELGSCFFVEALSPLEMIQRGFRDAMETLQVSEERNRLLVETARDIIYTLTKEGNFESINHAFETITGWHVAEWLGKPFLPIVHPDDAHFATEMFDLVISGESPGAFELRVASRTGWLVGEFTTSPLFREGRVTGALGIARDVTARRLAEEQLRESEERFRLIAENIDDLIVVLDTEGKRLYNSPSYESLLGHPDKLRGTDSFADIHPDDRARIRKLFFQTVASGSGQRAQYRILAKDGTVRTIESQGSVIKDQKGRTDKVIVVSRDVTARIAADDKIRKSEKQLAAAQQIAHLGSWEWDIATQKITLSQELSSIYGVRYSESGVNFEDYVRRLHPDDRDRVKDIVQKSLQTRLPFRFEHRILFPHRNSRILDGRGEVVVDARGDIVRVVATVQDVTELRQAEEASKELAKKVLNAQEEERRRVARELHDDVCQNLTGIRYSVEDFGDDLAPTNRTARNRLKSLLKMLDQLIGDVRRMSSNLRPTSLDDFGLVVAMRRLCEQHTKLYKTVVVFHNSETSIEHFATHAETALYRILQEALTNVAKYARADKVEVSFRQEDHTFSLEVEDNGKGFSRDQPLKARKSGHGFGLLSMKERAELLGGSFQIVSAPRKGTKIRVSIPIRDWEE